MPLPKRVLISGGRETGGVRSFAEALYAGFSEHNIPAEIVSPAQIFRRWHDLRDPNILKILSTTAVFAAPFARRAICVAHGFPRADAQGWGKLIAIIGSHKLANRCSGVQLVAVSQYVAIHLRTIFNLHIDGVAYNPLHPAFCSLSTDVCERSYVTYVGRLISAKNLHHLLPAIVDLLDANEGMKALIIGDGEERSKLEALVVGNPRFEFVGQQSRAFIRDHLCRTRLFVSGCETEALGITYLEALSQGCTVVMPACGGGLEIAPHQIGKSIHLLPLSWKRSELLFAMEHALSVSWEQISIEPFTASSVTDQYLGVDAKFSADGRKKLAADASSTVFSGGRRRVR